MSTFEKNPLYYTKKLSLESLDAMAPPKKWDDEDESSEEETSSGEESVEARPVAIRKKFDDEEDSDAPDNWEEAEDSEDERKKAAAAAAAKVKADAEAAKNKKSKAQRIEEHREANMRRKMAAMDDEESDEDEGTRRERLRKSEQDADLRHAEDLLSAGLGQSKRGTKAIVIESKDRPGETIDLSSIPLFRPATKTQFEALSEVLVPLLRASSSKPHYAIWVNNFCKSITQDLPSAEIKKAASTLTASSNEKLKEEKAQDKTGKKTKAQKTKATLGGAGRDMGRGTADTTAYDDGLDEDDFM